MGHCERMPINGPKKRPRHVHTTTFTTQNPTNQLNQRSPSHWDLEAKTLLGAIDARRWRVSAVRAVDRPPPSSPACPAAAKGWRRESDGETLADHTANHMNQMEVQALRPLKLFKALPEKGEMHSNHATKASEPAAS